MTSDALVDELAHVVGSANVLVDAELRAGYEIDWTGRWRGSARAVVRPGSTPEVAAVLRACRAAGAAVVPQGGNTGLVGGGIPRDGEIVVSTRRIDEVGAVDPVAAAVVTGAGATLGAVQQRASDAGLAFGVDLAARDSATVGGMVATDAGGTQVLRHGSMRAQVLGLEAVLADGSIVDRLHRPPKDSSGYDLVQLLVGSEGTLGLITRVRLRLVSAPRHRVVALVGLDGPAAAVALAGRLRGDVPTLLSLEVFQREGMQLVCRHAGLPSPLRDWWPTYVLAEAGGTADPLDELAAVLEGLDSAVATDAAGRERLWSYRERHTEAISSLGIPHKLDVSVPLPSLAAFEADARRAVIERWPGATVISFGHLAEGNLHVNVIGPPADDPRVDDVVLGLVVACGGSISAEHGIGVAKRAWLERSRSPAEMAAMRAVKHALDPAGLLNPGVLIG